MTCGIPDRLMRDKLTCAAALICLRSQPSGEAAPSPTQAKLGCYHIKLYSTQSRSDVGWISETA